MEKSINISRIGLLIKRHFRENLNYEVILWGILTLIFTIAHQPDFFSTVLNVSGALYAVRQYKSLVHSADGIHFFMIPAKQTEKLISSIMLTTVYYFMMTWFVFIVGSILGGLLSNYYMGTALNIQWDIFSTTTHPYENGMILTTVSSTFWQTFSKFITLQAIFLLGSLYFKKNATAKTLISIIIIAIGLSITELFILQQIFGEQSAGIERFSLTISSNSMGSTFGWISQWGGLLLTPYFWLICYYRLTEREV